MKCRQVSFYAESSAIGRAMTVIAEDVVPRYSAVPHFLGYVILQEETTSAHSVDSERREVTVQSFWNADLAGSEATAQEFISEVFRVAGTNPSRRNYDLIRAKWRGGSGEELASFP